LTIKRELPGNMLLQVAYVGSQGHRLLATYEVKPRNPQTCLDLAALGQGCSSFGEDSPYSFVLPAGQTLHLPYVAVAERTKHSLCNLETFLSCVITGAQRHSDYLVESARTLPRCVTL